MKYVLYRRGRWFAIVDITDIHISALGSPLFKVLWIKARTANSKWKSFSNYMHMGQWYKVKDLTEEVVRDKLFFDML